VVLTFIRGLVRKASSEVEWIRFPQTKVGSCYNDTTLHIQRDKGSDSPKEKEIVLKECPVGNACESAKCVD
jgi:hypothetical protein